MYNDQRPGEVNYETCLPDLGKSLISQPHSTSQNDALALSLRHIVRFSWRGLSNGPGYHMIKNMIGHFVFVVAIQAVRQEKVGGCLLTSKTSDVFLTQGFTNWKDATGAKHGGFPLHEHS